jgi:hypothetical protein
MRRIGHATANVDAKIVRMDEDHSRSSEVV